MPRKVISLNGADNLQLYLSQAVLPAMAHGSNAPFMPPEGHKAHRNHITVQPAPHRSRFIKTIAPRKVGIFDKAVLDFVETLPCERLGFPNIDEDTGFAFTVPARGFNIQEPTLTRPSTVHDLAPWVDSLPLQTMTRALHIALPDTQNWDVTYADDAGDPDDALWNTLVWRKRPRPPHPQALWSQAPNPFETCSVVFVVQPPWIMTPQDMKTFIDCEGLPPFNPWEAGGNRPFTSAERVWAKLWDMCVLRKCHHWVLSTYAGWVFGAFTEGYTAGQILDFKDYDAQEPTIMQCLVYHVASSMNLVGAAKLPQYLETLDQMEWDMEVPKPSGDVDIEYPDSGSEWDGMHDEPGISAGVSMGGSAILSAYGSQQDFCADPSTAIDPRSFGSRRPRRARIAPALVVKVTQWQHREEDDEPPPYERETSPTVSLTAESTAGIYRAAIRGGSVVPEVTVIKHCEGAAIGGYLPTVVEQGPGNDD